MGSLRHHLTISKQLCNRSLRGLNIDILISYYKNNRRLSAIVDGMAPLHIDIILYRRKNVCKPINITYSTILTVRVFWHVLLFRRCTLALTVQVGKQSQVQNGLGANQLA